MNHGRAVAMLEDQVDLSRVERMACPDSQAIVRPRVRSYRARYYLHASRCVRGKSEKFNAGCAEREIIISLNCFDLFLDLQQGGGPGQCHDYRPRVTIGDAIVAVGGSQSGLLVPKTPGFCSQTNASRRSAKYRSASSGGKQASS